MSRLKRWLNMNKKRVNSDGSLKPEYLQELQTYLSHESIEKHRQILEKEFQDLKYLDETDPEDWIVYTAADFFTSEEQRQFNPDGSLKPEYVEYALSIGISNQFLEVLESRKKKEIDDYNSLSRTYAEQGINFGQQRMAEMIAAGKTYVQRRRQYEMDLLNHEDRDCLPF